MASTNLVHEAKHSKPVIWNNPEGWGGEEVGGEFRWDGDTCKPMADSC